MEFNETEISLKLFSSESLSAVTLGGGTVVITKSGDSTTITSGDSSANVDITEISTADGVIFAIDTVLTGEWGDQIFATHLILIFLEIIEWSVEWSVTPAASPAPTDSVSPSPTDSVSSSSGGENTNTSPTK